MKSPPKGHILVRADGELHQRLLRRAEERSCSLNDLCLDRLSVPSPVEGSKNTIVRQVLTAASALLHDNLIGLVLYGSQARGDATTVSDWDFLVVTSEAVPISRGLYRLWESAFMDIPEVTLDVHFVHLPPSSQTATGFWGEVALDGIILYEENWLLSRRLGRIRQDIADGILQRCTVHGQTYWIRKEVA